MKTALILIGKFGCSNLCINNIMKNIIIPNDCDVFFYTFEDYYINMFNSIEILNNFKINDDDINYIKNVIGERLKSFTLEKTDKFDLEYKKMELLINDKLSFMRKYPNDSQLFFDSNTNQIKDFKRYIEQYFINNICFKLLEEYENNNNIIYHQIIRLRCDAYFYKPFIMPKIDDNTLILCGNPLNEWNITSFFCGSRNAMKIIIQNILDEMFIEPTLNEHFQNKELLFHEIQFGCAIKQLCTKNNINFISTDLMANCLKLTKKGISIHMGPYHTNNIISDDYSSQILKYIKDETTEFRTYIFLPNSFWINCNEETKYKEIDNFNI